jgi:hypothetical protein
MIKNIGVLFCFLIITGITCVIAVDANNSSYDIEGIDPPEPIPVPDPIPVDGSFHLPLEKTGFPLIALIAILSLVGLVFRR